MVGFWDPQILNFRIFFDVFSMSFFKRVSGGEKIDQKCEKGSVGPNFGRGLRWSPGSWGKERIGERTLQVEMRERMSRLASCDWTEPVARQSSTPLAHLRWPADLSPGAWGPPESSSKIPPPALFLAFCSIFGPSETRFKNDFGKTSKKVRKSRILASQNRSKNFPKRLRNRCPNKHMIFQTFLLENTIVAKASTSIPHCFFQYFLLVGHFSFNRFWHAFSVRKTTRKPCQNDIRTL